LFGRPLPDEFFAAQKEHAYELDALVIMGTSLNVSPANLLPLSVREDCIRVIINRDEVGSNVGLNSDRDYFLQGDCDDYVMEICTELGWVDEMRKTYGDKMCEKSRAILLNE
jgi:NAD-dependent SIR2 family protein deacetylase